MIDPSHRILLPVHPPVKDVDAPGTGDTVLISMKVWRDVRPHATRRGSRGGTVRFPPDRTDGLLVAPLEQYAKGTDHEAVIVYIGQAAYTNSANEGPISLN